MPDSSDRATKTRTMTIQTTSSRVELDVLEPAQARIVADPNTGFNGVTLGKDNPAQSLKWSDRALHYWGHDPRATAPLSTVRIQLGIQCPASAASIKIQLRAHGIQGRVTNVTVSNGETIQHENHTIDEQVHYFIGLS